MNTPTSSVPLSLFHATLALSLSLLAPNAARAQPVTADAGAEEEPAPPRDDDEGAGGSPVEGAADGEEAAASGPSDVHIGVYVNRVREVNLHDGTYVVDFWVWFRWDNDALHPHQTFELVNGEIQTRIDGEISDDLGFNYISIRLVAKIFHVFDVSNFPYDDHTLHIDIEDVENEAHLLQFVPDVSHSALDPSVDVAGWAVSLGETTAANHVYETNYGFLSLGEDSRSPFSRFVQKIELHRASGTPLFKIFWVTYLSVLLGLLALRVRVTDLDARFGLSVGSIFAAMANTYVLGEILPETEAITLAEWVNFLAVGTIFGAVFVSIASIRLTYAGKDELSRKLDLWAFVGLAILYPVANIVVVHWR